MQRLGLKLQVIQHCYRNLQMEPTASLEPCSETLPKARKVVAREPGVPGISPSLKNVMKCGSKDAVTRVVSRKV